MTFFQYDSYKVEQRIYKLKSNLRLQAVFQTLQQVLILLLLLIYSPREEQQHLSCTCGKPQDPLRCSVSSSNRDLEDPTAFDLTKTKRKDISIFAYAFVS